MAQVYVGIGSNIDRERHITAALDALADRFGALEISPVYESEAVGFDGDHFLNLVVGFASALPVGELSKALRDIEHANGRQRTGERFSGRTLDIDILTYGDSVGVVDGVSLPREEILQNAFVLLPLADLAPQRAHPVLLRTYSVLWQQYDRPQKLWAVDFFWRDALISRRRPA